MKMVPLETYEALLDKYNALVQQVLDLKRDGFARPGAPVSGQAPASLPELPDAVQMAIAEMTEAGVDPDTLHRDAWALLKGNLPAATVAQKLRDGQLAEL